MKGGIFTSIDTTTVISPVSSFGSGEMKRIQVVQKVHNGPKDTRDRSVCAILDVEESVDLAASLIGMCSADDLRQPSVQKALAKLKKFLKMAEAVD